MGSVYKLTFRQLSGRWRLIITLLLTALPVVMGVTWRLIEGDRFPDADFQDIALNGMLSGAIIPLVALAIASAAFSNEIEDRTLANLTLSPIPRWKIVLPKLLGAMTVSGAFLVTSAFITSFIAFSGDMEAVMAITAGAAVAVALYSSLFLWAGLMTTRAIGYGLLYVFLWEGMFAGLVSGVRFLSIRHYSLTVMHRLDERIFTGGEHLSNGVVIGASVGVFVIFLALSIRRLRRMDVP
ncbi:MAG: ABC transporter permease subunit [Chloroflexi bacterium]|nr:ABC transporter permease subunit [Chloroflexota bacterium]